MATKKAPLSDMNNVIADILDEYGDNVTEGVRVAVKEVAKTAQKEVKAASPVRKSTGLRGGKYKSGAYKRGWTIAESKESRLRSEAIVYNKNHYYLTHLLENGHKLVKGGRTIGTVRTFPHIRKAEENAIKNMERVVREIAQG